MSENRKKLLLNIATLDEWDIHIQNYPALFDVLFFLSWLMPMTLEICQEVSEPVGFNTSIKHMKTDLTGLSGRSAPDSEFLFIEMATFMIDWVFPITCTDWQPNTQRPPENMQFTTRRPKRKHTGPSDKCCMQNPRKDHVNMINTSSQDKNTYAYSCPIII